MNIHFDVARSMQDLVEIFMVRAIVFVEEQQVLVADEIDAHEYESIHVLGRVGAEPIAAGRIRMQPGHAKLERLAVRKAYRRQGVGARLLTAMLETAKAAGATRFKIHAQVQAIDFYRQFGFVRKGETFMEAGIEHICMTL